ncbi:MAG: hypothetical protein M3N98_02755 [Actinomycetota bacterium]|nr:hypothetical protein [Actinomycetota bacterium]
MAISLVALAPLGPLTASPASASPTLVAQPVPGTQILRAVACSSATACVAVGDVSNATGDQSFGVMVPIISGVAGPAQAVPGLGELTGVACFGPTACVAVGSGSDAFGNTVGKVVFITNGIPGAAQPVPGAAVLLGVACSSATTCAAVGLVANGSGGVVVPITNAVPGAVLVVPGADALNGVACSSTSTCVAVGSHTDPITFIGEGVLAVITNGTSAAAQMIPGTGGLNAIACPSGNAKSTCEAVGPGDSVTFFGAVVVPIISNTPGTPKAVFSGSAAVAGIACPNANTCLAVGFGDSGGEVASIINGSPRAAQVVAGSNTLVGVACSTTTTCVAVGDNASNQGVIVSIGLLPPCTTTLTGNHLGTLVAGHGLTCLLGVHLSGSVILPRGSSLDIENSAISGSIVAVGSSAVRLCGNTIAGSVAVQGATGFVLIGDPGDDKCGSNRIGGSLSLIANTHGVDAIGNHVRGAVIASGNSGTGPFTQDTAPDISGNMR